jgi:hypothetical protein
VNYFDVRVEDGCITLVPVRPERLAEVQRRLAELGLTERDVRSAVAWARQRRCRTPVLDGRRMDGRADRAARLGRDRR